MKTKTRQLLGFTLIEVLLAMAVFAIAGVALVSAANSNVRHISQLEQRMLANWVASNQLVEATLEKSWPPRNNKQGKVELAGQEWFWQQKVLKTADDNLRSVVIEIKSQEKDSLPIASMQTYVARPKR